MKKIILPKIQKVQKATDFVGIKIENGEPCIYLPQMFRINNNLLQCKKDLVLFLKSIELAKTFIGNEIKYSISNHESDIWPIESYLWIIHDYLNNGTYFNREKKYVNDGKGKIDWKRTMRKVPIISNNNFIYDEIISSRIDATNDIISQIYLLCVYQSQFRFGWLYGYEFGINVNQIKSIKEMIHITSFELQNTFDDEKRLRFNHMLNILQNIEGNNALSKSCTYGIDNYYYVFETMVDKIFDGISKEELKKYNPLGFWKIKNEDPKISSELRPDTIHIEDDKMYIIDAKMYQYGYTKEISDLPTTSSMQKQITYGDYVKSKTLPGTKIRNVFVLPYDKELDIFSEDDDIEKYVDGNLAYLGIAYVSWRRNDEDYDYIYTFLIDLVYLIRNYSNKSSECILSLINKIESIINCKTKTM